MSLRDTRAFTPIEYAAAVKKSGVDRTVTDRFLGIIQSANRQGTHPLDNLEDIGVLGRTVAVSYFGQSNRTAQYNLGAGNGSFREEAMRDGDTVAGHLFHAWISNGLVGLVLRDGVYLAPEPQFTFPSGEITGLSTDIVVSQAEGRPSSQNEPPVVMLGVLAEA